MFDFVKDTVGVFSAEFLKPWCNLGDVLLVGEGNLSFARCLFVQPLSGLEQMTATTFEKAGEAAEETVKNADELKKLGAIVLHGIDATKMEKVFRPSGFDTIIFQFPNVGSRSPKYGHNPNHVLLREFLRSAKNCLNLDGRVFVSAVDHPYYEGLFKFEEAAKFAGFDKPQVFNFSPQMFPEYSHTNTNDEESALKEYTKFLTLVFRLEE